MKKGAVVKYCGWPNCLKEWVRGVPYQLKRGGHTTHYFCEEHAAKKEKKPQGYKPPQGNIK